MCRNDDKQNGRTEFVSASHFGTGCAVSSSDGNDADALKHTMNWKKKEYDSMITLNKVLYPTDFSPAAEQAFDAAQRLARDSRSLLLIVPIPADRDDQPRESATG